MTDGHTKAQLAMAYARRGWKVFPIREGTKDRPMVYWGKEATSDQRQVLDWWTRYPGANIGLAVGQSGLVVVDLDVKHKKDKGRDGVRSWDEAQLEHGEAPETLTSRTPSGGIHHFYYGVCANSQDKVGPAIDTRGSGGHGGYVLLPGSSVDGRPYEWATAYDPVRQANDRAVIADLPEWVGRLVGARSESRRHDDAAVVELDQERNLRWAERYLSEDAAPAVSGHGGNSRTYYVACTMRDQGVSMEKCAELMWEHYNDRCLPPWTRAEVDQFAKNAYSYASVVKPGENTAEAHFGAAGSDEWGKAGSPDEVFPREPSYGKEPAYGGVFDEWVWIAQQQIFMRRSDKFYLNAASFDSLFGHIHERGTPSKEVFKQKRLMRKYESVAFLPGEAELTGKVYNTWVKPDIEPREGDVSPFLRHMEHVFPKAEEREALLDWMAWVLQHQTRKPNFMPLIQGRVGCGKSVIGELMAVMVGIKNTTQLRTEDVGHRFNSWVLKTRLGVIEELMGDEKRTLANRMKALVTQPYVPVEYKGKDILQAPNKCCFLAFTNHEDALRLENEDRRYLVLQSPAPSGREMGREFFNAIWEFVRGVEGPAALLHHLLSREVDADFGLGAAPMTEGHEKMRREGMPEVERLLLEEVEMGNPPFDFDLVAAVDLEACLPDKVRSRAYGLHKIIGSFLRNELKARDLGPHRLGGRGARQVRLWSLRRHEVWASTQPTTRAAQYLKRQQPDQACGADKADGLGDPLA